MKRMRLNPVMLEILPAEVQLQMLDAADNWIDPLYATLDDSTVLRVQTIVEFAYRAGITQGSSPEREVFPMFGMLVDVDESAPLPPEPTPLQTSAFVALEMLARKPHARRVDLDVNLVRELCEAALRQTPTT